MEITAEDHAAIAAAIRAAEQRTSAQLVCVLAHASSGYAYIPIFGRACSRSRCRGH